MTREEAIQRLKTTDACDVDLCEALDMAIKALEQKPCGDCISREEALKALMDEWTEFDSELIDSLIGKIKKLPSVTPQPKIGRWVRWNEEKENYWYIREIQHCKCSECGNEYDPHISRFIEYCPNCGAKMQEVEE